MMRQGLLLVGTAAILALGSTSVYAGGSAAGGIMLGNVDIRALQPPIDLRRKQLEAQDPRYYQDPRVLDQGRSVGYRHRRDYDPRVDD